jgi:hypothetical protein
LYCFIAPGQRFHTLCLTRIICQRLAKARPVYVDADFTRFTWSCIAIFFWIRLFCLQTYVILTYQVNYIYVFCSYLSKAKWLKKLFFYNFNRVPFSQIPF